MFLYLLSGFHYLPRVYHNHLAETLHPAGTAECPAMEYAMLTAQRVVLSKTPKAKKPSADTLKPWCFPPLL
jgi:hypothetical protein